MKKLLVIDGNSMLNRAFYGVKLLSNRNGRGCPFPVAPPFPNNGATTMPKAGPHLRVLP